MENPQQSNQNEIICSKCGAKLTFAPGTDSLKCEFCGNLNTIAVDETQRAEAVREIDFLDFIRTQGNAAPTTEITTIKCDSCGAETTFDPNIVSSSCDFCGSPLTAKEGTKSNVIEPKSVLPFKIESKEGVEKYQTWLKKLWFAPNNLKKYARQSEKLAGIYIPYWTFDSDTTTHYTGRRGDDYEDTETYTDNGETKTRTVTKTNWSHASGTVRRFFDDILVAASKSLPVKYLDRLEPWDLNNLVPYDKKYLSGFKSERYQIALEEGFTSAKEKMEVVIRQDIRTDIGGDRQEINSMTPKYDNITFKHILLPLWISAYRYNNKAYRFMVNARTGEVSGERPWSWIKITLAVIAAAAVAYAIYYFSNK